LPEVPGGTQLHLLQQVPQALWHKFGRDDNLHLATHAPSQSEIYNIIFKLLTISFILHVSYVKVYVYMNY